MKSFRHPWLALFLAFCLPAQALASVLIECELHLTDAHASHAAAAVSDISDLGHHQHADMGVPDCHGTSATLQPGGSAESIEFVVKTTATSSDAKVANTADTGTCFHCNGTCQNLKPLSLIAKPQQTQIFDNGSFARLSLATETGVRSNPARPPCPTILS